MGRFQRVAGSLPKPTCEGLQITSIIFQGEGAALALCQMLDESVNSRTGAARGIHVIRPVFLSLIEENAWGYTLSGSECQRKSKIGLSRYATVFLPLRLPMYAFIPLPYDGLSSSIIDGCC